MTVTEENKTLFNQIIDKAALKRKVYHTTFDTFNKFKTQAIKLNKEYQEHDLKVNSEIPFEFKDKGEFEFQLKFGGDILMFVMHTNVFEFSRDHEVMKTKYIQEEKDRSYCGIINIYNFLADSFKYNRVNDIGYMIGRIFINKDQHYFLEGKREIGLLFNNFGEEVLTEDKISEIVNSSIQYTLNFDLLTPPYDNVKFVTVYDMESTLQNMKISTGKRLGFRFQADHKDSE
ncbi:MAG: hypothetical protein JEZ03_10790 [Bacteroidales bacterium]|nr:hypothetical protein [Bacteroidales bacterium]